jgi:hypothetical protein
MSIGIAALTPLAVPLGVGRVRILLTGIVLTGGSVLTALATAPTLLGLVMLLLLLLLLLLTLLLTGFFPALSVTAGLLFLILLGESRRHHGQKTAGY